MLEQTDEFDWDKADTYMEITEKFLTKYGRTKFGYGIATGMLIMLVICGIVGYFAGP